MVRLRNSDIRIGGIAFISICLVPLLLGGCSSNNTHEKSLDRSKAAKLINGSHEFKECERCTYTLVLDGWNLARWGGRPVEWGNTGASSPFALYQPAPTEILLQKEPIVHWLYTEGYLQVSPDFIDVNTRMMDGSIRKEKVRAGLTLTNKGKEASKGWKQMNGHWLIPLATKKLVEITGIAGEPMMGESLKEVQYTFTYAPTKLGSELLKNDKLPYPLSLSHMRETTDILGWDPKRTYKARAMLRLYDDGWRVEHY